MVVFFVDSEQVKDVRIVFLIFQKKYILLFVLSVELFYQSSLIRRKMVLLTTPQRIMFPKSTIETLEKGVIYVPS